MRPLALLTLSLVLCLVASAQVRPTTNAPIPDRVMRAVARVQVQSSGRNPIGGGVIRAQEGTGIMVSGDGLMLVPGELFGTGTRRVGSSVIPMYGDPESVRISLTMGDGTQAQARLMGVDGRSGLAIVRLNAGRDSYPSFALGSPGRVPGQEPVYALVAGGKAIPGVIEETAAGVTAATRRFLPLVEVQLSQPASGLSGAPLVNSQGQFLGVICAAETAASGAVRQLTPQTTWFALTPAVASRVAEGLSRPPYVVQHRWVGVQVDNAPNRAGAIVIGTTMGGPAQAAGLVPGDVIVDAGGRPVHDAPSFGAAVFEQRIGALMAVTVFRNGLRVKVLVKVATQAGSFS
jgi:S1-C subfamily serine protease